MSDKQVTIEPEMMARLVRRQFPEWAHLPVEPITSTGTDNALFTLGPSMVVRVPRATWALEQVAKEQRWLPRLAPHLPLQIPVPLRQGEPGEGLEWSWSIYTWLDGEDLRAVPPTDRAGAAVTLAGFLKVLQSLDATGGPLSGKHNNYRGVPLKVLDETVRRSLTSLEGLIDTGAALAAWQVALATAPLSRAPVWVHGDLQPGNLLGQSGRLSAVIDFGLAGVGDPACDLIVAWNLFSGQARKAFRDAMNVDEPTWARGRGWALYTGLVALPYYLDKNPGVARAARHVIEEVLGE